MGPLPIMWLYSFAYFTYVQILFIRFLYVDVSPGGGGGRDV